MYVGSRERPLRLFEVLARNRQSALELSRRTRSALVQPHRMFTIPPRQQLSSPTRLAVRRRDVIYGSRTLALINPKACTTAHTRKREKRAFLTFFEKTLPSSHFNSSLTFPLTHAYKIFDRSIDSSKPKNTRLHRESENALL